MDLLMHYNMNEHQTLHSSSTSNTFCHFFPLKEYWNQEHILSIAILTLNHWSLEKISHPSFSFLPQFDSPTWNPPKLLYLKSSHTRLEKSPTKIGHRTICHARTESSYHYQHQNERSLTTYLTPSYKYPSINHNREFPKHNHLSPHHTSRLLNASITAPPPS